MQNTIQGSLMRMLLSYISENNPDLLLQLEEEGRVTSYLTDKVQSVNPILISSSQPAYIVEQTCLEIMITDLLPSKYNFVCAMLEEEFEDRYWEFSAAGILKFEAINILEHCWSLFEAAHFGEATENNRLLHYAVAGAIADYFDNQVRETETVSHGVQQPA